jgi:hypothetical protein
VGSSRSQKKDEAFRTYRKVKALHGALALLHALKFDSRDL